MSSQACPGGTFPVINTVCCPAEQPELKRPRLSQSFVVGTVETPVGSVPQIESILQWVDHWGTIKARFGVGRMEYAVDPGLYALGNPESDSLVFVSANYKMSFDELRRSLPGRDAWILVLDTDGINVWCAAGKGTFGTDELVGRIEATGLKDVVSHRRLIVPQLAGPGVSAHQVKKRSGFTVHYGPIRAQDLPAYLESGLKAKPEMRRKTFTLKERVVLIPVELVEALKPALLIVPVLFLLGGLGGQEGFWPGAHHDGLFAVSAFLSALVAGAVLNPILLPCLPGKAFATKGFFIGTLTAFLVLSLRDFDWHVGRGAMEAASWLLMIPALTAYLAMNFTGCSTFTSLSGVRKEMRWALPLEIGMAGCGFLAWITSRVFM
ncbi:MAG TPA: mercury methylation corrinoid protein HgcA [Syntrophales bacterium]|nr:mercury methylation corrinoid protein HgcA [Syntrophales bacterium]